MRLSKRIAAWFLALALMVSHIPATGVPVYAADVGTTEPVETVAATEPTDSTEPVETVPTAEEIVNAAYALEVGTALEGTYTLTGMITAVNTAYNTQYENVTVTIVVGNMTDKPIQCYRLQGPGANVLGTGDTITVTGTLKNYNGTIEFDAGCTLDAYKKSETPGELLITPEEIVNAAYALEEGTALEKEYTLTGVITSVDTAYNADYGNITVTIVVENMTDKPIVCYRMVGNSVELLDIGDTITVTGSLKNHNGTVEFDTGCTLDVYVPAPPETVIASGTCGENLTWTLIKAGTLTVSGDGPMTNYYSASDTPWYSRRISVKSVVINQGVTTVGQNAFAKLPALTSVTLPNTLEVIDSDAFYKCTALQNIVIPDSVTKIDDRAFAECSSLKNVTLSKFLTYLGCQAFARTAIEAIEIPKSLEDCGTNGGYSYTFNGENYWIYGGPFYLCESLKTVTFETGTTRIADCLLDGCAYLETVTIPDTVTVIEDVAFRGCLRLTKAVIGSAVTEIGNSAFSNCVSLTDVIIPNSVTKIGDRAFEECSLLKNVTLSKFLTYLGYQAFAKTAIEAIEIPKSLEDCDYNGWYSYTFNDKDYAIYGGPFCLCENLRTVTFESGTTRIADNLLDGCAYLETITIPDTVTIIENAAFRGCLRLTKVVIGSAVTKIGNHAFETCASLTDVIIPSSVTSFDDYAFAYCESLKSMIIPDSVTGLGQYCFDGCTSLENVKLSGTRKVLSSYAFRNCTSLKTIDIPAVVTTIYDYTFAGCTALESIHFPEDSNLSKIGNYAFSGCTALKEMVLPEKTYSVGADALQGCIALEKVVIPQSVKTLGSYAFQGCEMLKDISIADYSITQIAEQTFKDCPAIEKITLPKGLTEIGYQAFMNNTGLVEIVIPESVTTIDSTAFSYPDRMVIVGKTGSYAEIFAKSGGFVFNNKDIPVEGLILLDGVELVTMDVGETYRALFELYPEDANDVITLTASNNNVTINGHDIYARYSGDTVITATTTSGLTYEFSVHIRSVKNIEILTLPTKTSYLMGENFDPAGMVVQVNYYDGSSKTVEDFTVSGFDSSAEGVNTVTVKWYSAAGNNYSDTFTVEIIDPTPKLTGIFVDTLPAKLAYALREKLDTTGMVVKGNYTDGSSREITGYTVSGFNALKKGWQTITVTYEGFTDTFTVSVDVILNTVAIVQLPTKTEYVLDESLETDGLQLELIYSDGTTKIITEGFTVSGFDSETAGEQTITVTYETFTATFTVSVSENVTEPTEPTEPEIQADVAYKMAMNNGNMLYFNGQTESESVTYRLATSTDVAAAINVYLEAVEGVDGGYRLYFMNGETKTYIRVYERTDGDAGSGKGSLELVTDVPAEYFTYDATVKTMIYTADADNAYYMGTYSTYTTFSISNTSYITGDKAANVDVSQYPARFYMVENETPEPTEPSTEATEPSTEATEPSTEATEPSTEATEPKETQPVETAEAQISFADVANRVSWSADQQVWQQNGITVTNEKSASTSDIIDSSNPVRFYKSSKLTIAAEDMVKIVVNCDDYKDYATALVDSIHATEGVTVTKDGTAVTIEFATAVNSFVIEALSGGQVRVDSISVVFVTETTEPTEPSTEPTEPETEPTEPEESIIDSGTCGENLTWTLDGEGVLTISGTGPMYVWDNDYTYSPWCQNDSIQSVVIESGVTTIGNTAFYYCTNLTSIIIPNSVTSIGSGAFYYCSSLQDVYYAGSAAQWSNISIDSENEDLLNATVHYGKVDEEIKPGDFNGDNEVKNDDVLALLWYSLFPEEYSRDVDGDLNHDDQITNADVVILLWYALFPEECPLP